jgi:hypothetical protein
MRGSQTCLAQEAVLVLCSATYISLVEEMTDSFQRTMDMTTIKPHGFLRRSLDAFIAARQREAERYVSRTLLAYDDRTLTAHGYDRHELERRAAGTL